MKDQIKCSHCDGRGKVDLPEHLQTVLDVLREQGGESTSPEITKAINRSQRREKDFSVNSCNNALSTLKALNLVTRIPRNSPSGGRLYVYRLAPQKAVSQCHPG